MQLTQKETSLLKDLKAQEELCEKKYRQASASARDPQLSELFNRLAAVEQNHHQMLCQMENGTVPQVQPSGNTQKNATFSATYGVAENEDKKHDCFLCTDLLTAEKHASGLYNTCVFEFGGADARNLLNHIQTEEQSHGKQIYDYMSANSMQA